MEISDYRIDSPKELKLDKLSTNGHNGSRSSEEIECQLAENVEKMGKLHSKLYAASQYAVLTIFQGMDAAGKDGAIKNVMSGLNPLSTHVTAFKQPSSEELSHDYLWRCHKNLPERGHFGIFNRSYYEEVAVVRVHNLLAGQRIPPHLVDDTIWERRFEQIRTYEKYLYENGYIIMKFFLHISKKEQKERLMERIDDESKNWKFNHTDVKEREHWGEYTRCYQEAIAATSTTYAPWYVIPADRKPFARLVISEVIVQTLTGLKPAYPQISGEQQQILREYREILARD